jgi:hypothetical protein
VTDGTLQQDIKPELEAAITVQELQLALEHRVLRQLPLEDGISREFYDIVGHLQERSIAYILYK